MPQVRRRSGDMGTGNGMARPAWPGLQIRNAVTRRMDGPTQVVTLPNARSNAHPMMPAKVRGTVSEPHR